MPNKYLDSVQLARLVTKIKSLVSTTVAGYLPLTGGSVTGNLSVSGTITGDVTGTASGNLPLSGGTMTGNLTANKTDFWISNNYSNNAGSISIRSAYSSYLNGATLALYGMNHTNAAAGGFVLGTGNGTQAVFFNGKPDGTLMWANKEIERVNASGTKYIRYESGLQICFSSTAASSAGTSATFPVAFSANPIITVSAVNSSTNAWATDLSTTGFSAHTQSGAWLWYIAIGSWA